MVETACPTAGELFSKVLDVVHDFRALLTAPLHRRWHLHWGATAAEVEGALPSVVWPWLVQVACQRAGFYSHDLLDNPARPSATSSALALQHLKVGQWVPMSPAAVPTQGTALKVHSLAVDRWLLWIKPEQHLGLEVDLHQ